ncbi:MAG: hypothetical protein ACI9DM_002202 [Cyclobacteriaceae bacterium]|jgi:hypothetical protein
MRKLLFGLTAFLVFSTTAFATVEKEVEERPPDIGITDVSFDISSDVVLEADVFCYNLPIEGMYTLEYRIERPPLEGFVNPQSFHLVKHYETVIRQVDLPPDYVRQNFIYITESTSYTKTPAPTLNAIWNDIPIDPGWRNG